ncbi:MAG: DNA topoisomerase IV subunit B [Candidatus Symbiobacter sp.]|nr:DNA topoisomerase IV subunit B [Candidatus Symbiobacter sp.]
MTDLFNPNQANAPVKSAPIDKKTTDSYTAKDIEVLEGLEPVRRRPGMYIGGTDARALHHLVAELLDNATDEAVAGHANAIQISLAADGSLTLRDNGRGIPIDPHPKFPDKTALEVILTTLHSGGKFSGKAYQTSGGLHGVGLSVVNALASHLVIEVARDRQLYRQEYARGFPTTGLEIMGAVQNRRGTSVQIWPDPQIFGDAAKFDAAVIYRMARAKAFLCQGVEIRFHCDAECLPPASAIPQEAVFYFPAGLEDYVRALMRGRGRIVPQDFVGKAEFPDSQGRVEWAVAFPSREPLAAPTEAGDGSGGDGSGGDVGGEPLPALAEWESASEEESDGKLTSYCNTIPTPQGGTHENGLKAALLRAIKTHGERIGNKRAAIITIDDILAGAVMVLSVFLRDPLFQGQTKERLASAEAQKLVEAAIKDHFEHFLTADLESASLLMDALVERAEIRLRRREQKDLDRKSATRKLRLPGKLADCSRNTAQDTEIFLVEGDSAGGSAKQARDREIQAILPLRGKILNVASAGAEKLRGNQELADLVLALGCGAGAKFDRGKLRYERVIIMTDADVDGAHIAALLMTFFFQEMRGLIEAGHLYLAQPPLYRLTLGGNSVYASDDAERDRLLAGEFKGRKVEISRFKGLGEMPAKQLRDTTMSIGKRRLLQVVINDFPKAASGESDARAADDGLGGAATATLDDNLTLVPVRDNFNRSPSQLVEDLMGRKPESRFAFISQNAHLIHELDV